MEKGLPPASASLLPPLLPPAFQIRKERGKGREKEAQKNDGLGISSILLYHPLFLFESREREVEVMADVLPQPGGSDICPAKETHKEGDYIWYVSSTAWKLRQPHLVQLIY